MPTFTYLIPDLRQNWDERFVPLSERHWISLFEEQKAWWMHDGNPKRPHVILQRGDHSDGFFSSRLVLQNPFLAERIAYDLITKLIKAGFKNHVDEKPDERYIIGPALGAVSLIDQIARQLSYRIPEPPFLWRSGFIERMKRDEGEVMEFCRFRPAAGSFGLRVEDIVTSSNSLQMATAAAIRASMILSPWGLTILDRSTNPDDLAFLKMEALVSLIKRSMNRWRQKDCPLCRLGSKPIFPKKPASNWEILRAPY